MSMETIPQSVSLELYNPFYVTRFGLKDIEINSKPAVVHETNNLPHLLDAYFHQQKGISRLGFQAEISLMTLEKPDNRLVIDDFMRGFPELVGLLEGVTEQRDLEYEIRDKYRRSVFKKQMSGSIANNGLPSDSEQWRRDFIYSVALDHIGDMTYRRGFDLGTLCE